MASNNEKCASYVNCAAKFDALGNRLPALWVEMACISTENIQVTQNKNQDPACRGDSSATETVESTSVVATGQLELKDTDTETLADSLYRKSLTCQPVEMAFLKIVGEQTLDVNGDAVPVITDPNVRGTVICGIPDTTDTRDQTSKNFQFTLSRTKGEPPTVLWADYTGGSVVGVIGDLA